MKQIITAKLKIHLSQDKKNSLVHVFLAYRDALNYSSGIGLKPEKISISYKLQKLVYSEIRENLRLTDQMSYNVLRKVANYSKNSCNQLNQNRQLIEPDKTNKISKGLDKLMSFTSQTCILNYQRDFSFKTG